MTSLLARVKRIELFAGERPFNFERIPYAVHQVKRAMMLAASAAYQQLASNRQ